VTYKPNQREWSDCARVEALEVRQLLSGEPWGQQAKLIAQDQAVANYPSLTGAGEAIAIIDSGVDYNHPALGGGFGGGAKVEAGWDFQSNDGNPMSDTNAHGTGAAGIAASSSYVYKGYRYQGIAPGAKVIALRESNTNGVKAAMEWVLANRAKYNIVAVNYTDFGGSSATIYKDVLVKLINTGVFVSHASGNGGAGTPMGKALAPEDYSVGSVNLSGQVSSFTQRGSELDLLAPGEKVTLPYYDVGSKKHIYVDTADGTSWASPAAVGTAALIKQIDPRFTPAQIMKILQDSGTAVYDSASKLTYKRLNVNAAIKLAYERRPGTQQPPSSSGPIAAPPATAQSPFSGTPARIAADTTIQAEDFDNGGEGVAYHDTDTANLGGNNYRSGTGVDVESSSGGGRDVGIVRPGEWLGYTVSVATAGTYDLQLRVASQGAGGRFHVEVDGVDKTGQLTVPNTGKWQTWTTITKSGVSLTAGTHVVRLKMDSAGSLGYVGNFDWLRFVAKSSSSTTPPTTTQTPFSGTAVKIAGDTTIQAEDFDNGGENVAYHDTDTTNQGGNNYRAGTGVDVETAAGGGRAVSWVRAGEWLEYSVDLQAAGTFNFSARVASQGNGGRFHVEVDGADKTGQLTVPNTGTWQAWTTVGRNGIALPAGKHVIRLKADSVGSLSFVGNFDWLRFTPVGTAGTSTGSTRSAYQSIAGTSFSAQSGATNNGSFVGSLDQGDWVAYKGLDFGGTGSKTFTASVAAANGWGGKQIQVRVGSPTGSVIGTLTVPSTGSWTTFKPVTINVSKITGVQDIYLTFVGGAAGNVAWIKFA
jgi:hypothetical protein